MNSYIDIKSKQTIRSVKIIHLSLIVGLVIFAGLAIRIVAKNTQAISEDWFSYMWVCILISILGIVASFVIPEYRLKKLDSKKAPNYVFNTYTSTLILKYSLLELPALISLVGLLVFFKYVFLGIAAVSFIVLISQVPTSKDLKKVIRP